MPDWGGSDGDQCTHYWNESPGSKAVDVDLASGPEGAGEQ